jgi:hypothetical protein
VVASSDRPDEKTRDEDDDDEDDEEEFKTMLTETFKEVDVDDKDFVVGECVSLCARISLSLSLSLSPRLSVCTYMYM